MGDYISRDMAIARLTKVEVTNRLATMTDAKREIAEIPAAAVAPVRHGRWDDSGRYTFPSGAVAVRCTNCGCALTESEHRLYNWSYCPVCGAKMDGGDSDAAD